jgi:hypothetical protein
MLCSTKNCTRDVLPGEHLCEPCARAVFDAVQSAEPAEAPPPDNVRKLHVIQGGAAGATGSAESQAATPAHVHGLIGAELQKGNVVALMCVMRFADGTTGLGVSLMPDDMALGLSNALEVYLNRRIHKY